MTLSQELLTIGELSGRSGLPASTIRYWERVGILPAPARKGGQRRYPVEAVRRLAVLRLAQACGFRLDEMRQLVRQFRAGITPEGSWKELALQKGAELDQRMAQLRAMRTIVAGAMQCRCVDWNECGRVAETAMESISSLPGERRDILRGSGNKDRGRRK